MTVDLLQLVSRFQNVEDFETSEAYLRTRVRHVAPEAYLHTIYKPAAPHLVHEVSEHLQLPASVRRFYAKWNGAHLFASALAIFGCRPAGALLNRSDWVHPPPFDLRDANDEEALILSKADAVAVGFYRYDGSLACVHRQSEEVVYLSGEERHASGLRWKSIDHWITAEIERMSFLFNEQGRLLVPKEHQIPEPPRERLS